jgi:hypothetical protein
MENAIRGMRNPLESWDRGDSYIDDNYFILGPQDLDLAQRLIKGGTEHRKFLRQIIVSVDITAPLYWWKEFDTYKVGTVANSTSTMHKLTSKPISLDLFEFGEDFREGSTEDREWVLDRWRYICRNLEELRLEYLKTKDKFYWKELIRMLPESWLQTRTITMNYENLLSMYHQRKNHKLIEWHAYCDWVETLPYTQALFGIG